MILDKKIFSNKNSIVDKKKILNVLIKKKIKILPLNSKSVISILSDIDSSTQVDHSLYVDLLVKYYGFDFSDSVFLYSSSKIYKQLENKKALSFFNYMGEEQNVPNNDFEGDTDYVKKEYILKNIDHLHSLSDCGVCAFVLNVEPNKVLLYNNETYHNNFYKNNKKHCSLMPIWFLYTYQRVDKIIITLKNDINIILKQEKDNFFYLENAICQNDIHTIVVETSNAFGDTFNYHCL